jgi:hypothetical protein
MKTFSCTFVGHWPVGACAVIVAVDEQQAELDMRNALEGGNLDRYQDLTFVEIDTTEAQVLVLLDGDY